MKELKESQEGFAQERNNYTLLIIGCLIVVAGFILMIGGKSEDPNVFNPEVFSERRITVAPFAVFFGYMFIIYAILKRPKRG